MKVLLVTKDFEKQDHLARLFQSLMPTVDMAFSYASRLRIFHELNSSYAPDYIVFGNVWKLEDRLLSNGVFPAEKVLTETRETYPKAKIFIYLSERYPLKLDDLDLLDGVISDVDGAVNVMIINDDREAVERFFKSVEQHAD